MAAAFRRRGLPWRGFDAWVSPTLPGSGLSSSAAFEVLLGRIGSALFAGDSLTPVEIAQMAQWAENVYFGKPLRSYGPAGQQHRRPGIHGLPGPRRPEVRRLNAALPGYALCIVDSGADHAGLTDAYAAIPRELGAVCRLFGAEVLRQVEEAEFYRRLPEARRAAGDRAVLRAIHVFDENRRVLGQMQALENGDMEGFLALVNRSGRSSWEYLQNIARRAAGHQELAVTLACAAACCGAGSRPGTRRRLRRNGPVHGAGGGLSRLPGGAGGPPGPRLLPPAANRIKSAPAAAAGAKRYSSSDSSEWEESPFFQMGDDDAGAAQYKHRQHQRAIQNRAIHQIG